MPLSRQEIKENVLKFAKEWEEARYEKGESQTFWNEFFAAFGIQRKQIAVFEERVKNIRGHNDFIDLFWPGKMLAEHKSRGVDLGKATSQAYQYVCNLINQGRSKEIPRYIIVSDFARMVLHDLEPDEGGDSILEFPLSDLHKYIDAFGFISGYKTHISKPEDPANLIASELMGDVHDALLESGYFGHNLECFLVRIFFCLFAEDTGIFRIPNTFTLYIENFSSEDGSDLGSRIGTFFDILDTPEEERQKNLDDLLTTLRYVDGGLFRETLRPPTCNRAIRNALLKATRFDWGKISPAVFGSLFQCVMDKDARRNFGAHYTTEENILKLICPLFLDKLRAEFAKNKSNKDKLEALQEKLGSLTFFDPSCGCGNFLVLAYRELRRLEMDVFEAIHRVKNQQSIQQFLDTSFFSQVDVDQFYGIEIVEFPVRIAETALWLMDHQMNLEASVRFGQHYVRLPLKKSATIVHDNALRTDWNDVLPKEKCSYVLGNPPFVGKQYRSQRQMEDVQLACQGVRNVGNLDYVACWYIKATRYIQNTRILVGFVSTNSIAQGEQVEFLWEELYKWNIRINFAYPTFAWSSEARGKAHVHCVIIGFSTIKTGESLLFEETGGSIAVKSVSNISPYLIAGPSLYVSSRRAPICEVPEMVYGSKPTDGGKLMVSLEEWKYLSQNQPECLPYLRPILGSEEFINGIKRWCFWLVDANPREIMAIPEIKRRVELVKAFRLSSKKEPTRRDAAIPTLFAEIRQPTDHYLLVPCVSSEKRSYVPIGFVSPQIIASNATLVVPNAKLYHFGILTSTMHNTWMRHICGRLESRYRYSAKIVYNNFPWPENINASKIERIEEKSQAVLDARALFPDNTFAELYAANFMPANLLKAHRELDKAVDRAYRSQPFTDDTTRLAFLFGLYEKLTAPLVPLLPDDKKPNCRKK